jgi:hypothetical protein
MKTKVIFWRHGWHNLWLVSITVLKRGRLHSFLPLALSRQRGSISRYPLHICTYYTGIYNICYFTYMLKVPQYNYPYTYRKRHPKVTVPPITIQYLPLKIKIRKIITCPEPMNLKIHSFPLDARFIDRSFATGLQHF